MLSPGLFKRLIIFSVFFTSICLCPAQQTNTGGKEPIFFDFDSSFTLFLQPGFSKNLSEHLKKPLSEIGYQLSNMNATFNSENETRSNLIMLFSVKLQSAFPDTIYTIQVDLVKINEIDGTQKSQSTSFISLTFGSNELNTVKTVLSRKIIENLRIQYVCHLRVQSSPQGARIKTESGLEGVTPLEWIVPVGVINIEGQLKGYEPINHTIDLSEPGVHTCHLQLQKKAFYHSRMMIPGAALLLTSAVCFFSERYYFDSYHDMQKSAWEKNSALVEKTYSRAKKFGYLGTASLVLSAISFSLTFKF